MVARPAVVCGFFPSLVSKVFAIQHRDPAKALDFRAREFQALQFSAIASWRSVARVFMRLTRLSVRDAAAKEQDANQVDLSSRRPAGTREISPPGAARRFE